jgi:polyisoprenoid-binding protein YceI
MTHIPVEAFACKAMRTYIKAFAAAVGFLSASTGLYSENLAVDSARSRIQVDAKATGHVFSGELKKYSLTAEGQGISNKPVSLKLSWDFNDLKTGDDKRDKEMVKWLGGGHPKGSFEFVKSWDENAAGGRAQGNLMINGVSKAVSFPYTIQKEGEYVTIDGKVSMDYQDFKLPIIRAMAVMTVDPKLLVRFHVVGKVK